MKTNEHQCYPVFEKNQILSSTHLNRLREFLDTENRLTRNKLAGFGIVCGLKVKMKVHGHIIISKGYGVTTEGYILALDESKEYTRVKKYVLPADEVYEFLNLKKDSNVWEIFEAGTETQGTTLLSDKTAAALNEKIVVLFLELSEEILQSCTGTNCDNKGKKKNCTLRVLLINKSDLAKEQTFLDSLNGKFQLPELAIKRFRLFPLVRNIKKFESEIALNETFDLAEDKFELAPAASRKAKLFTEIDDIKVVDEFLGRINNPDYIFKLFNNLIDVELKDGITGALKKSYEIYKSFLQCEYENNPFDKFENDFDKQLKKNSVDIQYLWDFLCELNKAYNEFRGKAFNIFVECSPDIEHFPQHLLLGFIENTINCMYQQYRYPFFQPPVYNNTAELIKEVKHLFKRLVVMISEFHIPSPDDTEVKIIPSKEKEKLLGEWSIPFYYFFNKKGNVINDVWNYNFYKRCRSKQILSHFSNLYNSEDDWIKNPLNYLHDDFPFYRIEGIHGKDSAEVLKNIDDKRKIYNLPFKTIVLNLENDPAKISVKYDKAFYDLQEDYLFQRGKLFAQIDDLTGYYEKLMPQDKKALDEIESYYKKVDDIYSFRRRIDLIFSTVNNYKKLFPECVKDFDYENFKTAYKNDIGAVFDFILIKQKLLERVFYEINSSGYDKQLQIGNTLLNIVLKIIFKFIDGFYLTNLLRIYFGFKRREYYLIKNHPSIFSNFIKKHVGLEHLAGVYKGGTFILVCFENKVIADFALPYVCCTGDFEIPACDGINDLNNIKIAPFARPDFIVTTIEKPVEINVISNDEGFYGAVIEFKDFGKKPKYGNVNFSKEKNAIIYTPGKEKIKELDSSTCVDQFTYIIKNTKNNLSDEGNVTVVIIDEPLEAKDDNTETTSGNSVDYKVMANDVYPYGTQLIFAETNENILITKDKNSFEILSDDQGYYIRFTPRADFTGNDQCQYKLVHGARSSTATFSIIVNPAESYLEAVNDSYNTVCNKPIDLDVLFNDKYNKSQPVTLDFYNAVTVDAIFKRVSMPKIITRRGAEVYLINNDVDVPYFNYVPATPGEDSFEYQIKQGNLVSHATVNITVDKADITINTVRGSVTINGDPISQCEVFIVGTKISALTDVNGNYRINSDTNVSGKTIGFYLTNYERVEKIICSEVINADLVQVSGRFGKVTGKAENSIVAIITADENKNLITDSDLNNNLKNSLKFADYIKSESGSISKNLNEGKMEIDLTQEFEAAVNPIVEKIQDYNKKVADNTATAEDAAINKINVELFNTNMEALLSTISEKENDVQGTEELTKYISQNLKEKIDIVKETSGNKTEDVVVKIAAENKTKPVLAGFIRKLNI